MFHMGRRSFAQAAAVAAAALPGRVARAQDADWGRDADRLIADQFRREQLWAFARSFYGTKDLCDSAAFNAHFAQSGAALYQDATLNINFSGYTQIAADFTSFLATALARLGPGRFSKLFHVTGDLRFGAIAEYVDLQNTFYSTNGITIQTVLDFDNGQVARDTDYWDTRELGASDIIGPAVTAGVALPLGTIHAGGVPLASSTPAPPGPVSLATGVTGRPSASSDMVYFAQTLHQALTLGSARDVLEFFTEDAAYVNPLIHQGPVLYGNFDQTIQIKGRELIGRLFQAGLQLLPDCRGSTLVHVVGGPSGGGFEWKAGGPFIHTGINRDGLVGCTALDLTNGKISRMSVKFDTFQLAPQDYEYIRSAIRRAGVRDA